MQSRFKKNNKDSVEKSVVFRNIFSYFGFCKPSKDDEEIRRTSTIPADPASQMEMRLSKMNPQKVPDSAGGKNIRYILGIPPYSQNQVFVLGHKDKIIAKLTSKTMTDYHSKLAQTQNISPIHRNREILHVSPLLRPRLPSETFLKEDFALGNNESVSTGISLIPCPDQENQKLSGSNIASYLAHRLKCDVLIDAVGGIGYNLRQFSKYCNQILAFEVNSKKVQVVQKQLENYPETQNIDFIMADFRKTGKLLWSDVVFINSDFCQNLSLEALDSELSTLLAKSLQVSHSVALKLPANINIDDLPHLFNVIIDKYNIYAKRFCIEIETVMNEENEVECTVIYFGNCSKIEIQDEYEAIYDYFLSFEEEDEEFENPKRVLRHPLPVAKTLFEKIGVQKVLKNISEIEEDLAITNLSFSLYELFLEKIINQQFYTKENLERTIEEESYKAKSTMSILNSGNTLYYTTEKLNENKEIHKKPVEENKETQIISDTMQSTLALGDDEILNPHKSQLKKADTNDSLPKFKVQHKNTDEYSDLSISSYAVSSDFFDEDPDDSLMDSRVTNKSSLRPQSVSVHQIIKLQSREIVENPLEILENKQRAVSNNFNKSLSKSSLSPKKNINRGPVNMNMSHKNYTPLDLLNNPDLQSQDQSEFVISGMNP